MGSKAGQRLETSCTSRWIKFALIGLIVTLFVQGSLGDIEPTESQCRPYIEKALKEQHVELEEKLFEETVNSELNNEQGEFSPTDELTDSTEGSITNDKENDEDDDNVEDEAADGEVKEEDEGRDDESEDAKAESDIDENIDAEEQNDDDENREEKENGEADVTEKEDNDDEKEQVVEGDSETETDSDDDKNEENETDVADDDNDDDMLNRPIDIEVQDIHIDSTDDDDVDDKDDHEEDDKEKEESDKEKEDEVEENDKEYEESDKEKEENEEEKEGSDDEKEENDEDKEDGDNQKEEDDEKEEGSSIKTDNETDERDGNEEDEKKDDDKEDDKDSELENEENDKEDDDAEQKADEDRKESDDEKVEEDTEETAAEGLKGEEAAEKEAEGDTEEAPEEEELIKEVVIPENLRPRNHIDKILRLEDSATETLLEKTIDTALKALKTLYDNAIKPLEILYKYRDLSNRHFGDPEIFSKPLILFMGPWSGGKSSTINYLLDNEFSRSSLRTGAEPSPAYFNILMHGEEEEILDGTQLAADWTFSGLQKFGQSLLDRLRGIKMPNKLLEKVNIVEIPGILEIRKQVQRLFPFNDACQWFIDRADIIFLIYDPSKLDVGPETEAILDQLKGREYQTRIILNKADQVKPEELMRVQGTLIWNISPLMSSSEPPIMYSTSLWSLPYETGAPTRLLQAQERAFLKDLREAIDKRVENKIASARRFAVRVRNHAKMVDCYLTTYYNHKSIFGNRKKVSDDIIEYPQKYHIYEGLSTLTNISRYDLPDPDVYKDFFKINPLYEFKKLSETCTYFRGCPINKLDVAIAYDLPELVGKYKKTVEATKEQMPKENS